jgi:hypothetical protein
MACIRSIADINVEQTDPDGNTSPFVLGVNRIKSVAEVKATDDPDFFDIVLKTGNVIKGLSKEVFSNMGPITPYVAPTPAKIKKKKAVELDTDHMTVYAETPETSK